MKYTTIAIIALALISLGYLPVFIGYGISGTGEKARDADTKTKSAVFAGGCFWCTESDFEKAPGVIEVISGYTGGKVANPTYEQVSSGNTGHVEAIKVIYDPNRTNYEALLDYFWRHVDPTDPGGQFVDRGAQYRSVIFYGDEEERRLAEASRQMLTSSGQFRKPIVTEILPLGSFYAAEAYHQDYYKKNPMRYSYYRYRSGRDQFLEKTWASRTMDTTEARSYRRSDAENLRQRLSPLQYEVTQEKGTEPPFDNLYWNNHQEGIYVDIVSNEPLFSSTDKYESGTGWPSFTRPLEPGNIIEKSDRTLFTVRTEVRSRQAGSHLGHLFPDGPEPTGLRYCINSAALRFIPKEDLKKEGFEQYQALFR